MNGCFRGSYCQGSSRRQQAGKRVYIIAVETRLREAGAEGQLNDQQGIDGGNMVLDQFFDQGSRFFCLDDKTIVLHTYDAAAAQLVERCIQNGIISYFFELEAEVNEEGSGHGCSFGPPGNIWSWWADRFLIQQR